MGEAEKRAVLKKYFEIHGEMMFVNQLTDCQGLRYVEKLDAFIFERWSPRENISYGKETWSLEKVWATLLERDALKFEAILAEFSP